MGWAISLLGGTLGQAKREPESTSTGKGLRGAADPEPDRQGLLMGPPVSGSGMLATKLPMPIPCLLLRIGRLSTRARGSSPQPPSLALRGPAEPSYSRAADRSEPPGLRR
jgi:hypothetical protein